MKLLILLSLGVVCTAPTFAQFNVNQKTNPSEKLFVKHVNLLTNETETWEVKAGNKDFLSSDFVAGFTDKHYVPAFAENRLKSLDLVERITEPEHPERTILFCNNTLGEWGAAVLISPRHILTVGWYYRNAVDSLNQIVATSLALVNKQNSHELARATDIYFFATNLNDYNNDIALITLDRPLGAIVGWMGYGYNTDDNIYKGGNFYLTSIQRSENTYELLKYSAVADIVDANTLRYLPNIKLTSGCPLYHDVYVHGIHTHFYGTINNGDTAWHEGISRITPQRFSTIQSIIDADTPNEPDIVPLKIEVAPHKTDVLDPLNEIGYRIFNNSKANFSDSIKLTMFLSTDNLIDSTDYEIISVGGKVSLGPKQFISSTTTNDLYLPLSLKPGRYFVGAILTTTGTNAKTNVTTQLDCDTLWVENLLANNYISGKIITSGESSGLGFCLLFGNTEEGLGKLHDMVLVDENLNYQFKDVFIGRYVIVYVPLFSNNLCNVVTYYNETPYWQNATVLELSLSDTIRNVDIVRIELEPLAGNKSVSGQLSETETKSAKKMDPAFFEDISIMVENQTNGAILAYCNPDSTGFYEIKKLTTGNFNVSIDKPGYTLKNKYPVVITDETMIIENLNFMFYPDSTIEANIGTLSNDLSFKQDFEIYPNPARDYIKIITNVNDNKTKTLNVINILGKNVKSLQFVSGTAILNINDLPQGNYLIQLTFSDAVCTKKMIKK